MLLGDSQLLQYEIRACKEIKEFLVIQFLVWINIYIVLLNEVLGNAIKPQGKYIILMHILNQCHLETSRNLIQTLMRVLKEYDSNSTYTRYQSGILYGIFDGGAIYNYQKIFDLKFLRKFNYRYKITINKPFIPNIWGGLHAPKR